MRKISAEEKGWNFAKIIWAMENKEFIKDRFLMTKKAMNEAEKTFYGGKAKLPYEKRVFLEIMSLYDALWTEFVLDNDISKLKWEDKYPSLPDSCQDIFTQKWLELEEDYDNRKGVFKNV